MVKITNQNKNVTDDAGQGRSTMETVGESSSEVASQPQTVNVQRLGVPTVIPMMPNFYTNTYAPQSLVTIEQPSHNDFIWVPNNAASPNASVTDNGSENITEDEVVDRIKETFDQPAKEELVEPAFSITEECRASNGDLYVSIFVCVFAFIFGLLSVIFLYLARKAQSNGDTEKADRYLLVSLRLKLAGSIVALVGIIFAIVFSLIYIYAIQPSD